jgi:hypothetical protein
MIYDFKSTLCSGLPLKEKHPRARHEAIRVAELFVERLVRPVNKRKESLMFCLARARALLRAYALVTEGLGARSRQLYRERSGLCACTTFDLG